VSKALDPSSPFSAPGRCPPEGARTTAGTGPACIPPIQARAARLQLLPRVPALVGEAVALRTVKARGGIFLAGIGNACRQPGKRLLAPESMGHTPGHGRLLGQATPLYWGEKCRLATRGRSPAGRAASCPSGCGGMSRSAALRLLTDASIACVADASPRPTALATRPAGLLPRAARGEPTGRRLRGGRSGGRDRSSSAR
jgi:hypothetical protein